MVMAAGSVVQVGNGIRHIPLPPLANGLELNLGQEQGDEEIGTASQYPVIGGFIGSGQLAWRAAGPTVEVVDPGSGARKAAWTFGAIMHNAGAKVTTVCGVGLGTVSQVAIGVDLGADRAVQGLVALLSLHSSRVTRVFHFMHKVTALAMVSGGEVSIDSGTLAPELRPWRGIIVVGTAHGTLHLLDLALDLGGHKVTSDELSPASLKSVVTPDPQAERNRISVVRQHCHLSMCLSDGMSHGGRFQLIGPDDSILFETSSHLVTITAVKFIPQLASLVVGYNFGAFQIINLSTLTIDCTSPYEDNVPPVHSFACQEPENDPKNFVYLWLCRSWNITDGHQEKKEKNKKENHTAALCTMYAMNYDNKLWIEGHGLWYQGLASISPRFEFTAMGGVGLRGQPNLPSCVFVAMTVQQTIHNSTVAPGGSAGISALATPDEDSGPVPEQSLCFFGWLGKVMEEGSIKVTHNLAVFDINQWYQAQMPSSLKLVENHLCPFMSFHMLDRVPGCSADGSLLEVVLGAAPKPASWARHMSRSCTESDWYPASLSYDCYVLTNEGLMEYQCQSAQQAALNYLTSCGPSAIVNPEAAYSMCLFAGLISQDAPPSSGISMMLEREALLTLALDEQLVSFLLQCVNEFSEGRFTNLGCSLPSLLEWAWSRVCSMKTANDSLCMPMFDIDSGVMSSSNINTLHQNLTSLTCLTTVITSIRDCAQTNMITLQGAGELENRVKVVGLLMLHINVVLWFYHCGLLSHDNAIEDVEEFHHVPFPAELLHRIYKNRRSEIKNLSSTLKGSEVLLIDGLLEDVNGGAGGQINKTWAREDGDESENGSSIEGAYPPPSLHALLDMFLLPSVSTTTKHRIVQYLFLDLASLLSDGYVRVVEELVKYPSSFSLSPSHIKLTQAFWLLDHKDFQEGLNVLLDPLVSTRDITPLQHQRIIKAFLYQGEHARALTYNQIRQPPRVDVDDIRLHLTLLLANGLIREAFHFQRQHRLKDNAEDLLNHFFTGCEQLGKLESVIHLPLSPMEEETLVTYLQTSPNKAAHDYLLVYYLQRARYEDAALLQDILRGGFGIERKRHGVRSALIHGYLTHLPDVAKRLTSSNMVKQVPARTIYNKPQPLSAKIHQARFSPKSHAGMIEKMMEDKQKAGTSSYSMKAPFTPFRNRAQRRQGFDFTDDDVFEDISLKRKSVTKDISQVVFPSRIMDLHSPSRDDDGEIGLFNPAPKYNSLGESSLLREDMSKMMESILRKSVSDVYEEVSPAQTISADLLSLLRTPKVTRRKRQSSRGAGDSLLTDTPQSILKVKQSIQRPISPSASSETSLPVFPRIATSAKKSYLEEGQNFKATDTSLTPKQLRFHLPRGQIDTNGMASQSLTETSKDDSLNVSAEELGKKEGLDAEKASGERLKVLEDDDYTELEKSLSNDEECMDIQEEEEQSFVSVDIGDKFERSIEVQEEEASLEALEDSLNHVEENDVTDSEINSDILERSIEVGGVPVEETSATTNVFRHPYSGLPSPRQPLRGFSNSKLMGDTTRRLDCKEEIIDRIEVASNEELSSKEEEPVVDDSFHSVNEENMSVTHIEENVEEDQSETENLVGAERSFEVGGVDNDEPICQEEEPDLEATFHEGEDTSEDRKQEAAVEDEDSIKETLEESEMVDGEKVKVTLVMENKDSSNNVTEPQDTVDLEEDVRKEPDQVEETGAVLSEKQEEPAIDVEDIEEIKIVQSEVSPEDEDRKEMYDTAQSSVTHNLNDSEYINSLRFSDSESDVEERREDTRKDSTISQMEDLQGRVIPALNENFGTESVSPDKVDSNDAVVKDDGKEIKNDTLQVVSEKEEEMITEVLSEEGSFVLNLDTSEQFSHLNFSDDSDLENEPEETGQTTPDIKEAVLSREGILKHISVDEAKVAIAEGAEENSMEANMPEEESVETCMPEGTRRIDEIVPENEEEPVIPEMKDVDVEDKHQEIFQAEGMSGNLVAKSVSVAEADQSKNSEIENQIHDSGLEEASCEKDIRDTRVGEETSLCEKGISAEKEDRLAAVPEVIDHSKTSQDSKHDDKVSEGIEEMEADETYSVVTVTEERSIQRNEVNMSFAEIHKDVESESIPVRENKEVEGCDGITQEQQTSDTEFQKDPVQLIEEVDIIKVQDKNIDEKEASLDNSQCVDHSLSTTELQTSTTELEMEAHIPASEHEKDTLLKKAVDSKVELLSDPTSASQQNDRLESSKAEILNVEVKEHQRAQEESIDNKEVSILSPSSPSRRSVRITPQKMQAPITSDIQESFVNREKQISEIATVDEVESFSVPSVLNRQSTELVLDKVGFTDNSEVLRTPAKSSRLTPDKPDGIESHKETSSLPTTPTRRSTRITPIKDELELRLSPFLENTPKSQSSHVQSDEKTTTMSSKDTADQFTLSPSSSKSPTSRGKAKIDSPMSEARVLLVKIASSVQSGAKEKGELNEEKTQKPQMPQPVKEDDKMEAELKESEDNVSEHVQASQNLEGADVTILSKTGAVDDFKSKVTSKENSSVAHGDNAVEPGNSTPRRSRRLSSTPATPIQSPSVSAKEVLAKVSVEHMAELGHTTPLRRSRRLSSATATPATPTRSSKRHNINSLQVTPLPRTRLNAAGLDTADKTSKSGRKISDVPTPLTKVNSDSPGSSVVTPSSKKAAETKSVMDEVNKVAQKLLLSPERTSEGIKSAVKQKAMSSSGKSEDDLPTPPSSPSLRLRKHEPSSSSGGDPVTPGTVRRSSRRRSSISEQQNLEDSKVLLEKGRSPKIKPANVEKLKTPIKEESESPKASHTPSKRSTPSRSRKTPSRLAQGFETLETISEDTEVTSRGEAKKSRTPSRALRSQSSLSESTLEVATESPSNSRRKSRRSHGSEDSTVDGVEARGRTTAQKKRESSADSLSSIVSERTPPSVKESAAVRKSGSKRRPSRKLSESEDEVFKSNSVQAIQVEESKKSGLRSSTDRVKSLTSSPITSVKDSESSEEEERNFRKRVSRKRSLRVSNIPDLDEVILGAKRTKRTSLAKSLLSSSAESSLTLRHSVKSLKIYSDDKSSIDLTPEKIRNRRTFISKKSIASDRSILIINESDEGGEMVFTSEVDSDRNMEDVKAVAVESPEIALNLMDGGEKVKRRRTSVLKKSLTSQARKSVVPRRSVSALKLYKEQSASQDISSIDLTPEKIRNRRTLISKKSIAGDRSILVIDEPDEVGEMVLTSEVDSNRNMEDGKVVAVESPEIALNQIDGEEKVKRRRTSVLKKSLTSQARKSIGTRHSVSALELNKEKSASQAEDSEMEAFKVKQPHRSVRRTTRGSETSVLEIDSGSQVVNIDINENKKSNKETEKITEMSTNSEKKVENEEVTSKPQFTFAEPKPVISTRQSRALQSLMGEAVEFLFSPPQPQGRIVKTHAKIEKPSSSSESEKARSSSESEKEIETPVKRSSRRRK
ncbi:protein ELYS-like isoform X3 [Macrobrachium nipponense]|uniref:protein ELYS-like isoform X3 n=1 Tax=Macrobrachium nipponense TaxID=159736 RepID=UPI0030C7B19C